ncbi:hypothetical protein PO883_15350 [Massilia sp. DJPM01]|uniref:cyanobactin maturation protease PatG family protein n=1 Tax=Massilia sp. DJPM01 TaxID=3024404 RepID=UPI00259E543C|nr:hypothetical protein [Massilia sp. DJPM01]MDM5178574.1 hypothetical protein [Massilia sp. DJPM01]
MDNDERMPPMISTHPGGASGSASASENFNPTTAVPFDNSGGKCASCAEKPSPATPSFIYALGRIVPHIPRVAVAKELLQAAGSTDTAGLTDRQWLHKVISMRQNRYLARQLCWVLTIEGLDTYLLVPRDPTDLELLVEATRPTPSCMDLDLVVGVLGPIAPPEACNGLMLPIVGVDQVYSFDRDCLIKAIPQPDNVSEKDFGPIADEIFSRLTQLSDNAGATDEHRALNYLCVRYPAVYATAADAYARNFSLSGVEVRTSRLSGVRRIVDVIFSYANRQTDVTEKYFTRVDVSDEFLFLVSKMSPYYDR